MKTPIRVRKTEEGVMQVLGLVRIHDFFFMSILIFFLEKKKHALKNICLIWCIIRNIFQFNFIIRKKLTWKCIKFHLENSGNCLRILVYTLWKHMKNCKSNHLECRRPGCLCEAQWSFCSHVWDLRWTGQARTEPYALWLLIS